MMVTDPRILSFPRARGGLCDRRPVRILPWRACFLPRFLAFENFWEKMGLFVVKIVTLPISQKSIAFQADIVYNIYNKRSFIFTVKWAKTGRSPGRTASAKAILPRLAFRLVHGRSSVPYPLPAV